jgi:hypothetical protein
MLFGGQRTDTNGLTGHSMKRSKNRTEFLSTLFLCRRTHCASSKAERKEKITWWSCRVSKVSGTVKGDDLVAAVNGD